MNSLLYKCREKEGENIWKNIQKKACSQSGDATSQCQFIYKILTFFFEQFFFFFFNLFSLSHLNTHIIYLHKVFQLSTNIWYYINTEYRSL